MSTINTDIKQQQRYAVTLACRKGTLWLFSLQVLLHTYWASKCTSPVPIFLTETAGIITALWTFESSGLQELKSWSYMFWAEVQSQSWIRQISLLSKKCIDQSSIIQYFWLIKRSRNSSKKKGCVNNEMEKEGSREGRGKLSMCANTILCLLTLTYCHCWYIYLQDAKNKGGIICVYEKRFQKKNISQGALSLHCVLLFKAWRNTAEQISPDEERT